MYVYTLFVESKRIQNNKISVIRLSGQIFNYVKNKFIHGKKLWLMLYWPDIIYSKRN